MPATTVFAVQALSIGGGGVIATQLATDSANGNAFYQDGKTLLRLVNTDASSRTVTFTYPIAVDGNVVPAKVLTLAAGEIRWVAAGLGQQSQLYPGGLVNFQSNNVLVKYELVTF